jgi:phosphoribosyl 1,2-cyclic phosphate phosphodiesterase
LRDLATLRITMLGCGSSPGVPRPDGNWGACDPTEPKNRRRRSALLVQRTSDAGTTNVVIDTGPDFRDQMINAGVTHIDGVVYTHAHADHVHGIDDLRSFVLGTKLKIQVYADDRTLAHLTSAFNYIFARQKGSDYPPIADANLIETGRDLTITGKGGPIALTPFGLQHGPIRIKGFRIGGLAYCTDVSGFPDKTVPAVTGLDVLIIGALQYQPHPSHFTLAQSLEWIERLGPKRAVLTHMHIPLDYQTVLDETPTNVEPGYDGMVIELAD